MQRLGYIHDVYPAANTGDKSREGMINKDM